LTRPHGVRRLGRLDPARHYEGAWVLALPGAAAAGVRRLRRALAAHAPDEAPLPPHVTLVFLGRWPGLVLERWRTVLGRLAWRPSPVTLANVAVFRRGARVANLHLRVEPDEPLRAFHERALDALLQAGWTCPSDHVRGRYTPHVTLFDGLDADPGLLAHPALVGFAPQGVVLDSPVLIGKPVPGAGWR
jgi:2'-5' RNA ligase